jgi:hypothetical protein
LEPPITQMKKVSIVLIFSLFGLAILPMLVGCTSSNLQALPSNGRSLFIRVLGDVRFWALFAFAALALTFSLSVYLFLQRQAALGTFSLLIFLIITMLIGAACWFKKKFQWSTP